MGSGFRMMAGLLAGVAAGALVAHSMYLVLFLGVALGPLAAVQVARRVEHGGLVVVLAYALGFGLGLGFLSDGKTVTPGDWRMPFTAALFTALAGGVVSLLSQPSEE